MAVVTSRCLCGLRPRPTAGRPQLEDGQPLGRRIVRPALSRDPQHAASLIRISSRSRASSWRSRSFSCLRRMRALMLLAAQLRVKVSEK